MGWAVIKKKESIEFANNTSCSDLYGCVYVSERERERKKDKQERKDKSTQTLHPVTGGGTSIGPKRKKMPLNAT